MTAAGWKTNIIAGLGLLMVAGGTAGLNQHHLAALLSGDQSPSPAPELVAPQAAALAAQLSPLSRSLQHLRIDLRDARLSLLRGGWAVAAGQLEENQVIVDDLVPRLKDVDARRMLSLLQRDLIALDTALQDNPVNLVQIDRLQLQLDQQADWLDRALADALVDLAADNKAAPVASQQGAMMAGVSTLSLSLGTLLLLLSLGMAMRNARQERAIGVAAARQLEGKLEDAAATRRDLQNVVKTREGVVAELEARLSGLRQERETLNQSLAEAQHRAASGQADRGMYRGLADIAPGAAFYSADGDRIDLCNPACDALFGGVPPTSLAEVLDETGRDKLADMLLGGQGSLVVRDGIVPRDNSGQDLILVARPLQAGGEEMGVHGFVAALLPADNPADLIARLQQDMESIQQDEARLRDERDQALENLETLNREVEETLEAREAALQEARREARVKADLLAVVSHETRTPLTGLKGVVELLLGTKLDERQARYARSAAQSIDAALSLLNDMLDLSKMDADRLELVSEPFDLARLSHEVLAMLEPRAVQKGLAIEIEGADAPIWLKGDQGRIRQILLNLVGNAVKFTNHGFVRIALDQRQAEHGLQQSINVIDSGPGIAEEELNGLFDAFTQTESGKSSKDAGTGLGLAISQGLAHRMDGKIDVHSRRREGSIFTLSLSLPEASDAEQQAARERGDEEQNQVLSGMRFKRPLKILLAEDNDIVRMVVTEQLESMGHKVVPATTGRLVVVAARDDTPDVVLMDVNLPDMNGLDATRAIRDLPGRPARLPIIALTANALDGDAERCLAAGMDDFLVKPVPMGLLANKLAAWGDADDTTPVPSKQAGEDASTAQQTAALQVHEQHLEIDMPDTDQAIDQQALDMLMRSLGQIRGLTLITDFIREIDTRFANISAAVAAGDYKTCEAEAHLLKGSAGSMKAGRVFACADAIVEACRDQDHSKIPGTMPLLQDVTAELTHELKARLVRSA